MKVLAPSRASQTSRLLTTKKEEATRNKKASIKFIGLTA
jgi:hypothetical protein